MERERPGPRAPAPPTVGCPAGLRVRRLLPPWRRPTPASREDDRVPARSSELHRARDRRDSRQQRPLSVSAAPRPWRGLSAPTGRESGRPRFPSAGRPGSPERTRPTLSPPSRVILTLHRRLPNPPPPPPPSLSSPPPRKRRNAPRSRLTGRLGGPGPRPPLRPRRPRMRRPPAGTIRGRGRATTGSASPQPGLADTHALPARRAEAGTLVRKLCPTPRELR